MEAISVERLDHLGVVASVMKDVGMVEMIDTRLGLHDQEESSAGEAVAGMILNGLGFSARPLTFTPQFFANNPLDLLFREGVRAEMCNRFTLGRTLDEASGYGCDLLLSELALSVCRQESIDSRFNPLDTTSFSLTGDYVPDSDELAIAITHGLCQRSPSRPETGRLRAHGLAGRRGAIDEPKLGWQGLGYKDFPGACPSPDGDLQGVAHPSPRYLGADATLYTEEQPPLAINSALSRVFQARSSWSRR